MKCPLCSREFFVGYVVFHPPTKYAPERGEIAVCGQCFLLVNILEILKEIKDGIAGRSKPPFNN